MNLSEYEAIGGCRGCMFYERVEGEEWYTCTFPWDDEDDFGWECAKNCDELE